LEVRNRRETMLQTKNHPLNILIVVFIALVNFTTCSGTTEVQVGTKCWRITQGLENSELRVSFTIEGRQQTITVGSDSQSLSADQAAEQLAEAFNAYVAGTGNPPFIAGANGDVVCIRVLTQFTVSDVSVTPEGIITEVETNGLSD
jgi:hypothetical protein